VTGPPVQMTATGTYSHGSHPATTKNITNEVTWSSDIPDIATVSSTGLAQVTTSSNGVTGNALITASAQGGEGPLSASSTFTKAQSTITGCAAVEPSAPREDKKL
jgi:hypothetical protein